jgi:hypothetical protein
MDHSWISLLSTCRYLSSSHMIFVLQEEVRSKLASLEVCHQNEIRRTISAFARLQKYAESRKEIDRRLDVHFQRRMYGLSRFFLHFLKSTLPFPYVFQITDNYHICFSEQHLRHQAFLVLFQYLYPK